MVGTPLPNRRHCEATKETLEVTNDKVVVFAQERKLKRVE
jgi:hypothetical protein